MLAVLYCVADSHDLRLVAIAALICATACVAAFGFHDRAIKSSDAIRWSWTALTGLVAGCGVWATHFTAMLAYQPSLQIQYEILTTATSLVIAVIGTGVGFALPVRYSTVSAALVGGAFTGLGIGAMHYTGLAAVRAPMHIQWNEGYVVASLVVGVIGGAAAFYARRRLRGRLGIVAPAALLVLAIVGMHFTGMTAVELRFDPRLAAATDSIGRGVLAFATVALAALILASAVSLIWMERLGRRATLTGLRHALDAVPFSLAFFDADDRLLAGNEPYMALLTGCGVTPVVGTQRTALMEATLAAGWQSLSDDLASRVIEGASTEITLPDGRWFRYERRRTEDGGTVTVMNDITAEKETAQTLAAARDTAEAANRAKSAFLANISHEIRTPLHGVLGVAELLAASRLSARQRELVGVIRKSGVLLDSLLGDLLDLARIEAGAAELRPEPASIGEIVASVRDLYAPAARDKGLALELAIGAGADGEVICDPVRLRQVLGNLVSNAVKFTDAGRVAIAVERDGEALRFEVRDTGPGFDLGGKEALFQRFRQGDATSTRRHGGAGLGLAICDEYVRLMGSELDCDSRPGEGACFSFVLEAPLLAAAPQAEAPALALEPVAARRVLVVDDNPINRQLLQLILESVGIDHAAAADGQEAVAAAMAGEFDAVLMDIQMPVMDGLEAIRRIRVWERAHTGRHTPIYIVSANGLKEHVDAGRAAGADGHLNKPVGVHELLSTLAPHIGGRLAA